MDFEQPSEHIWVLKNCYFCTNSVLCSSGESPSVRLHPEEQQVSTKEAYSECFPLWTLAVTAGIWGQLRPPPAHRWRQASYLWQELNWRFLVQLCRPVPHFKIPDDGCFIQTRRRCRSQPAWHPKLVGQGGSCFGTLSVVLKWRLVLGLFRPVKGHREGWEHLKGSPRVFCSSLVRPLEGTLWEWNVL